MQFVEFDHGMLVRMGTEHHTSRIIRLVRNHPSSSCGISNHQPLDSEKKLSPLVTVGPGSCSSRKLFRHRNYRPIQRWVMGTLMHFFLC